MGETKGTSKAPVALPTTELGLVASILVLLGLIYLLAPPDSFFTKPASLSLLHQIGLFGVLAVGAAVVIISGGIDLSVGAIIAVTSVVAAKMMTQWLHNAANGPPPIPIILASMALALALGLLIGLFHALLINKFSLPPFIATLATMSGLRSLAAILSENRTINLPYKTFRYMGAESPATFSTFAVVAVSVSVMMGATVLGRHLFALGGNEAAARLSGLKTARLKTFAYGLSGTLAALAGLLFAGRNGQAGPQLGLSYELFAITSAVVGGCSLSGGVGSIRGTVLGLVLLQTLIRGTSLVVRKVDFYVGSIHVLFDLNSTQLEGLVLGTVIIFAVAINQRLRPKL